jgi:heme-degrading monooxygenase HmoA
MTTIRLDASTLTEIHEFDLEPEEEEPLRHGIERLVRDIVISQPGFVSASLHVSRDGRKVLAYLQWESLEALERFRDDEQSQRHIRPVIGPYGPRSRVFDVVFTAVGPASAPAEPPQDP